MAGVETVLDKLERGMERIELVTVIREPNTGMSADAYNGLRKQVIAAVNERNAHLHQLAQFDAALKAGATPDELASLVREWLAQAGVETFEDISVDGAFESVGPEDGQSTRLVRPAYVDTATGRVVRAGIIERYTDDALDAASTAGGEEEAIVADVQESDEPESAAVAAGGAE
jgi:hypothetical protein